MYKKKHAQKRHKQVHDCFKLDSILFKKNVWPIYFEI